MPCNSNITPAQKEALQKQVDKLLGAGDAKNAALAAKLEQLMASAFAEGKQTVAAIIKQGLKEGLHQDEILAAVKGAFPDSKANYNDIAYYKTKLKKEGLLPGQTGAPSIMKVVKKPAAAPPLPTGAAHKALLKLDILGMPLTPELQASIEGLTAMQQNFLLSDLDKLIYSQHPQDKLTVLEKMLAGGSLPEDVLLTLQKKYGEDLAALKIKTVQDKLELSGFKNVFVDTQETAEYIEGILAKLADPAEAVGAAIELQDSFGAVIWNADLKQKVEDAKKLSAIFAKQPPSTVAEIFQVGLKKGKPPEEIQAAIQQFMPSSKTAHDAQAFKNSLAYYKTQLKKAGELPGQVQATVKEALAGAPVKPLTAATPLGTLTRAQSVTADVVLGDEGALLGGSNGARVWKGTDGIDRVVKFYPNAQQAWNEHITNQVYRQLGHEAAESGVIVTKDGRVGYWSAFRGDVKTLGEKGLTKAIADKVLDGYAADVLTANWDVIGLSLDNIGVTDAGQIIRLDNGSGFLFRAQAGKFKPDHVLKQIGEFEQFASGINPSYSKIFAKAGTSPAGLGERIIRQIDDIEALEKKLGGWGRLVDAVTDGMSPVERGKIRDMLEARSKLLYQRRDLIKKQLATMATRSADRAVAFREIETRMAAAKVDDAVDTRLRAHLRQELGHLETELKTVRPSQAHHGLFVKTRDKAMEMELRKEFASDAEFKSFLAHYKSEVEQWFGSSSSDGAAMMKRAAELEFGDGMRTVYHGSFLDHDDTRHAQFLKSLSPWAKQNMPMIQKFIRLNQKLSKAFVKEFVGGHTIKVRRGVATNYWTSHGLPVPQVGEEWVDVGNPMASWSVSQGFSSAVKLEAEVSAEDIYSIYIFQPGSSPFWNNEREVIVLGRPLRVRRIK